MAAAPHPAYPVRVTASVSPAPNQWLWLVKWLLAVPHLLVLLFLWLGFAAVTVIAFFAILFTTRYPRPLFNFNAGVLRWHWRVGYYAYGVLGTDRYPPFTLAEVPDYPAHLEIDYPERLSRGLVLVKWWLLALPHYLVLGAVYATGAWAAEGWNRGEAAGSIDAGVGEGWRDESWTGAAGGLSLVGSLVLIAAVGLLFTAVYPKGIYDFLLGLHRWALRVAGYAALMTDRYPPFRLDQGPEEPAALDGGYDGGAPAGAASTSQPGAAASETGPAGAPSGRPAAGPWSPGWITALVLSILLTLGGLAAAGAGAAALAVDSSQRQGGFLTSSRASVATAGHALVFDDIRIRTNGRDENLSTLVGQFRVRVSLSDPARELFVGVAPRDEVTAYLDGVARARVLEASADGAQVQELPGSRAPAPPATQTFWTAQASGTGTQQLQWTPSSGDWAVVVMNADASPGVAVSSDVGVLLPWLPVLGVVLLVSGGIALLLGIAGIVVACVAVNRRKTALAGSSGS